MRDGNINNRANANCLSLIRLIAAIQVMMGHIIEHYELSVNSIFFKLSYFFRGVPIFFVISGFLIWFSVSRSKTYRDYLKKRFWRIYPELWVAVAIEIVVLITLYHEWNVRDLLLFSFGQASIFQFFTPDSLRGYGVGTPNGALWTIGVMIQFYIIAWFVYIILKNRRIIVWIIGFIITFCISFFGKLVFSSLIHNQLVDKLYDQTVVKYLWLFYIGMFIANYNEVFLPYLKKYWCLFLMVAFVFFITGLDLYSGYYLFWSLFMTCGLIGFAYKYPSFSIPKDISYGLFLYHMTVVNAFVHYNCLHNWLYAIPTILLSVLLAYLSTISIGRLSAEKKKRLS